MSIEKEIISSKLDTNKIINYGFKQKEGKYIFEKNIMDNRFKVILTYDKEISGKIIDLDLNEEYDNFRRDSLGEFSSMIKNEYILLLKDIKTKCGVVSQRKRINDFIINKYTTKEEYLWDKYPSFAVYRNKNDKWFCLIGSIELNKLDKNSNSSMECDFINLKINEDYKEELIKMEGFYEAYHMNKKKWITIKLDDTVKDGLIEELIYDSYNNVK